MERTEKMELDFLLLEKESIKQFSKKKEKAEKEPKQDTDLKMNIEDVKRKVDELVPVNELDLLKEDDISITTIEEPDSEKKTTEDRPSMSVFNSESDGEIKISVKSESEEGTDISDDVLSERTADDEQDDTDVPRYKFPTF